MNMMTGRKSSKARYPDATLKYFLRLQSQHDSKTQDEVSDEWTGGSEVPSGGAAIRFKRVPPAAANDFEPDRIVGGSLGIGYRSAGVSAVPILTPFQNISFHVVQSPGIR